MGDSDLIVKRSPQHLDDLPDGCSDACYPCRLASVSIAPSATPTRSPEAARAKEKDPQLERDRDAYKRLRRDGTQPITVKGSERVEKEAVEKWEVDTGRIVSDPKDRAQYTRAFAEMPKPNPHPINHDPGTKKAKKMVDKRERVKI